MGAGLATTAEDKKQDSSRESSGVESPQWEPSRFAPSGRGALGDAPGDSAKGSRPVGAPFGMPLFLQPQVQMKCAECAKEEEEEKRAPQVPVQKKCAHCEEEEKRQREQGSTPVQAKCAACEAEGLKEKSTSGAALDGVASANRSLPHLDRIQASFGRHDVSGARAAVGGPAAEASGRMGALAYTSGDRVAFRSEPDVNLAAHEAAHVVQQRNGAKLPGGVGRPGDEYEQQADAAAKAVERGESAEPILDRTIPGDPSGSAPVVQHALAVNAFRMFEPASVATHVALSTPRGADEGARAKTAATQPRRGAAQSGQSALAQADQGVSPAPAAQAAGRPPAPAGGPQAQTSAPAGFHPHCYNADYDEPSDDSDDEPKDDKKSTDSKEEVHPDLPRPHETDNCAIEGAIKAQAPAAPASAGQQAAASAPPATAGPASGAAGSAPAPSGNAPAPAPSAAAAGPNAEAGADTAPVHAAGNKIRDNAHAAASAPSPLEDAIAQAEAGRDAVVSSFQSSDSATQTLEPRIAALSADVSFLPETSAAADWESRAAEMHVSDFFANAAERLNEALASARDTVPDRLGDIAESMKGNIAAGIEQQKAALSANIENARLDAFSSAQSARAQVHADHRRTVAVIQAQTDAAIEALRAAHQDTIDSINETETDALDGVNELYSTSYDAHVALGPEYADHAEARGEQYAQFYETCIRYNPDGTEWKDGFFAGYLTNRRARAEMKAARETSAGYRKSLIETANDQAAQAMKGRRKDRCGIIATARRTRTSADDRFKTLTDALERGRQESIAQAAHTRDTMLAHSNSGLNSALPVLDLLEHDGKQSLDDTGYLQQLAIEQAAHASASAVQESVAQAVGNVETALSGLRATLAESPAPAAQEAKEIFAQASAGLNSRIDVLAASTEGAQAGATARLQQAGTDALAALDSDAQTSFSRITNQSNAFSSQMDSLAAGAAATFATLRTQYTEQAQKTSADGAEGFTQAESGFERACDTALQAIETALSESELGLTREFEKQIGGLDSEETGIPKQAALAASKEQPAWKKVLAVVLIIAIVIVVALVIGPAIIGAVGAAAAALGASAGVATAVGAIVGGAIVGALSSGAITVVQNWSTGQRLTRGLRDAMLVGAATGAIGGAIGLGVNAGLNAVLGGGGRLALSAGAQFAVRAATNMTSDAFLNVGQQMFMTGHVDWGEFAQGMAMSIVLHGSRRIQAFQARVTAVGARGTARGIGALGGAEPSAAATRASRFAGQMEHHATTAEAESKKPLDWTRPTRTPVSAQPATPPGGEPPTTPVKPAPAEVAPAAAPKEVAPATPPREAAPATLPPEAAPARTPAPAEAAAPKPVETTAPEPTKPAEVAPEAAASAPIPEERAVLENTARKSGEELTPSEVNAEREVARKTEGKPINESPFTTEHELPNGHKFKESADGKVCERCSPGCGVYNENGELIGQTEPAAARGEEPAFKPGSPRDPKSVTQTLRNAGLTEGEIVSFGGADASRLGPRTAGRVAQLGEHFTAGDLKALGGYLERSGVVLDDDMAAILIDNVPPGGMRDAVAGLETAEVRASQTGVEKLDPESVGGPQVREPRAPSQTTDPKQDPLWRIAEKAALAPLEKTFGPGWEPARIQAPGAEPTETLGSTAPDYYNARQGKAFEVKRFDLAELGIGPEGQQLATPSERSLEALARARRQIAGRRWALPKGTEQSILFNVTGQGVTDIQAVGQQLRSLLNVNKVVYDRVWIQNGSTLTEIL